MEEGGNTNFSTWILLLARLPQAGARVGARSIRAEGSDPLSSPSPVLVLLTSEGRPNEIYFDSIDVQFRTTSIGGITGSARNTLTTNDCPSGATS